MPTTLEPISASDKTVWPSITGSKVDDSIECVVSPLFDSSDHWMCFSASQQDGRIIMANLSRTYGNEQAMVIIENIMKEIKQLANNRSLWATSKRWKFEAAKSPQKKNSSDCGIYAAWQVHEMSCAGRSKSRYVPSPCSRTGLAQRIIDKTAAQLWLQSLVGIDEMISDIKSRIDGPGGVKSSFNEPGDIESIVGQPGAVEGIVDQPGAFVGIFDQLEDLGGMNDEPEDIEGVIDEPGDTMAT
jgi:hypothetical protein